MRLRDYMSEHKVSELEMASRAGCSEWGIKKLRFGERTPSLRLAMRIFRATDGKVGLVDWFDTDHQGNNDNTTTAT